MKPQVYEIIFDTIDEFEWTTADRDLVLMAYYRSNTRKEMVDIIRKEYLAEDLAWDWGVRMEMTRFVSAVYDKIENIDY